VHGRAGEDLAAAERGYYGYYASRGRGGAGGVDEDGGWGDMRQGGATAHAFAASAAQAIGAAVQAGECVGCGAPRLSVCAGEGGCLGVEGLTWACAAKTVKALASRQENRAADDGQPVVRAWHSLVDVPKLSYYSLLANTPKTLPPLLFASSIHHCIRRDFSPSGMLQQPSPVMVRLDGWLVD
jgi:hypothetical protein